MPRSLPPRLPWMLALIVVAGCAEGIEAAPGSPESTAAQGVIYNGPSNQFAGGFAPSNAPDGGFGGGTCVATRTPVIFVHGNSVNATFFAKPSTTGVPSVYDTLRAAGYSDCELFGITWLSPSEQAAQQLNYHTSAKAARIRDFITAVKAYTGKSKVHILGHSMGVTVAIHGITFGGLWGSIDSFVNVAGGLKGLSSCLQVGFANPAFPTCGSQNVFDSNIFGFWPDGAAGASNPRTGTSASVGFRREPERRPGVRFFTISGGSADTMVGGDQCKFNTATALKAQLDVGVDHLASFTNTGAIMNTMLNSACTGTACCAAYSGACSNL
ncbi:MAG: alpha/beta hydrolase [Deltaproteobacteria bacterium]|nr:MAG: alpha/beta hydrolase [Deltaproteobacteria bacterium]